MVENTDSTRQEKTSRNLGEGQVSSKGGRLLLGEALQLPEWSSQPQTLPWAVLTWTQCTHACTHVSTCIHTYTCTHTHSSKAARVGRKHLCYS